MWTAHEISQIIWWRRVNYLGSSCKSVTRFTNANVQAQLADMQVAHDTLCWVFLDFFGISRGCSCSRLQKFWKNISISIHVVEFPSIILEIVFLLYIDNTEQKMLFKHLKSTIDTHTLSFPYQTKICSFAWAIFFTINFNYLFNDFRRHRKITI